MANSKNPHNVTWTIRHLRVTVKDYCDVIGVIHGWSLWFSHNKCAPMRVDSKCGETPATKFESWSREVGDTANVVMSAEPDCVESNPNRLGLM